MNATLTALAVMFSQLSLIAFGGGNTILPEMHRQVTEVHHWLTDADFAALFALAQAAPGPNMMVAPLIGWHVAGLAGMLVSTVAIFGPSSILTAIALRLWRRFKDNPWRRAVQAGLVPVSVGLVAASALLIVRAADRTWILVAISAGVALVATRTRLHPLWLLAAGAVIGWSGFGQ
ncbi:MAG TPA: chromate transporter [Reyranella sp.]|jgi:chromate transporter|nr:chromate transporter [Reyranella sp.]HKV15966.1 chromate transporter [Reyranella sp.]